MRQDSSFITGAVPGNAFARAISEPGKQYAFYIHHSVYGCWFWEPMGMGACYTVVPGNYQEELLLNFEPGRYNAEWIDPATGIVISSEEFIHEGGTRILRTPQYMADIALRMINI